MIAAGHPDPWSYTPRQIAGYLFLSVRRQAREAAMRLSLNTLAARGEPREVKKQIRELSKDKGPV